ncbi:hypothetical protein [Paludibacterium denitrificans]|uniref:Uncharacterized protein n=1 Tax=Paludibacterium denitrificans TaxID=2675226 RepID=A0A844GDV0_9NEIS|nr:hypothetical protein [Paludibacterium denitrificans]MTD33441.1 hypothetical protein [Paludibacterium denitrificans]
MVLPEFQGEKMGGNASLCCFNLTDYRKPVKVKWVWSGELGDPVNVGKGITLPGKIIKPDTQKESLIMLPQRNPIIVKSKDYRNKFKSEDTLCVIFRDMDTVELQYSSGDCREY